MKVGKVSVMNIWDGVSEVRRRAANGSKPCGSQTGGRDCERRRCAEVYHLQIIGNRS